jgi:hypothetical protein
MLMPPLGVLNHWVCSQALAQLASPTIDGLELAVLAALSLAEEEQEQGRAEEEEEQQQQQRNRLVDVVVGWLLRHSNTSTGGRLWQLAPSLLTRLSACSPDFAEVRSVMGDEDSAAFLG